MDHIIHTSVSMGKNMYGQPAMNFTHEGGIGAIAEHLRQLLAQDVGNHLDRKLYEENLSRPTVSTALKPDRKSHRKQQQAAPAGDAGRKSPFHQAL
ncbi:MAG: hypothetical protein ACLUVG_21830 [Phocaeicola vulgatus]